MSAKETTAIHFAPTACVNNKGGYMQEYSVSYLFSSYKINTHIKAVA